MNNAPNNLTLPSLRRHATFLLLLFLALFTSAVQAARTSANYSITTDSVDLGGARAQSAAYSMNGSAGGEFGTGTGAVSTSAAYTDKPGYVGTLYDVVSLSITAPPSTSLNENASRQLAAAPLADDATTLASLSPSSVTWSVVSGPITSISAAGIATAATVYQNTAATAKGLAQGLSGQLTLTILNVTTDDYGAYAGDGIDDAWQVQYFGQPPNANAGPNADPDHDGLTNLFEFTAGLVPTDPTSRFIVSIQTVTGQASQKKIVFQPIVSGRTYTVQAATSLPAATPWPALTNITTVDNGTTRTVTDLSATGPKFYHVQITKP